MTNMSLKSKGCSAKSGPPPFSFDRFLLVLFFEIVGVFEWVLFRFSVLFFRFVFACAFSFSFRFYVFLCSCAMCSDLFFRFFFLFF